MKGVFDTNILIDYLNGHSAAKTEYERYAEKIISRITSMEVLVGMKPDDDEKEFHAFLDTFRTIELTSSVIEEAIRLRRSMRIKLPDAIIYATAKTEVCNLLTRNTKDFGPTSADIIAPYIIS